jgi:hypothetical protein
VGSLAVSCNSNGGTGCTKKTDTGDNTCRYITWGTASGDIKVTACQKSTGVEVYRNSAPSGTKFSACFGNGCVNEYTGFAKVTSSTTTTPPPTTTPAPSTGSINMASLNYACSSNNQGCTVKSDQTSGSCRTILFGSSAGDLKIQGCDKGSGYIELYKQQAPNTAYSVCLANGCVNQNTGFVKFQLGTTSSPTQPTVSGVNGLSITATPNGKNVGDFAEGTACRKVQYTTDAGWIEARVCQKSGSNYEMYLLSPANAANVCVGSNCVGSAGGFKAFSS